jgi:hypothetical protein
LLPQLSIIVTIPMIITNDKIILIFFISKNPV